MRKEEKIKSLLESIKARLEYLSTHNKNYTKKQYFEIDDCLNDVKSLNRELYGEKVVFYEEPNEYTGEIDILAVFPGFKDEWTHRIGCYRHFGQHSEVEPDYIAELKKADISSQEVKALIFELEHIAGHVLKITK